MNIDEISAYIIKITNLYYVVGYICFIYSEGDNKVDSN